MSKLSDYAKSKKNELVRKLIFGMAESAGNPSKLQIPQIPPEFEGILRSAGPIAEPFIAANRLRGRGLINNMLEFPGPAEAAQVTPPPMPPQTMPQQDFGQSMLPGGGLNANIPPELTGGFRRGINKIPPAQETKETQPEDLFQTWLMSQTQDRVNPIQAFGAALSGAAAPFLGEKWELPEYLQKDKNKSLNDFMDYMKYLGKDPKSQKEDARYDVERADKDFAKNLARERLDWQKAKASAKTPEQVKAAQEKEATWRGSMWRLAKDKVVTKRGGSSAYGMMMLNPAEREKAMVEIQEEYDRLVNESFATTPSLALPEEPSIETGLDSDPYNINF